MSFLGGKKKGKGGLRRFLPFGRKAKDDPGVAGGSGPVLEHGLSAHHPGAVDGTEVTSFNNDFTPADTGKTHEKAVAYGAIQAAANSDPDHVAEVEEETEESALAQGSFRAAEVEAEAAGRVAPEIEKTVLPENRVKLIEDKADYLDGEANRIEHFRLFPLEAVKGWLEECRDRLPWISKLTGHLLVSLVIAAIAMIAFDAVIISMAAAYLPIEWWARWPFALTIGLAMIAIVSALSWLWASVLGADEHDRLWRRPPVMPFIAAVVITLVVGGMLGYGIIELGAYRAEAVARKAHSLAIDPVFTVWFQGALAASGIILETIGLVLLKAKVLAREVNLKQALIAGTRAQVNTLRDEAYQLRMIAARLRDDATGGLAMARITGILFEAEAKANAAIKLGESAAAAVFATFYSSHDATRAGLFAFLTGEEQQQSIMDRIAAARRQLMLTIAGIAATVFAGITGWILLGAMAGISAALATGAAVAFRAGMDPDAKGSTRRMARKSEPRTLALAGVFALATGTATTALLGILPGIGAAIITAAILTWRAWGGTQPPDQIDPEIEANERDNTKTKNPFVFGPIITAHDNTPETPAGHINGNGNGNTPHN